MSFMTILEVEKLQFKHVSLISQSLQLKLTDTTPQALDDVSCPQVLETGSDALDSSIPAFLVHIGNTYQCKESHLLMRGVARAWGAGIAENGWWRRLEKGCAERGADWVKNECCSL